MLVQISQGQQEWKRGCLQIISDKDRIKQLKRKKVYQIHKLDIYDIFISTVFSSINQIICYMLWICQLSICIT